MNQGVITAPTINQFIDADGTKAKIRHGYVMNVLLQTDRLAAALLGAPQDTTVSAELAQKQHNLFVRLLAHALTDGLDFIEPHHVEHAAESDEAHAKEAIQVAERNEAEAHQQEI